MQEIHWQRVLASVCCGLLSLPPGGGVARGDEVASAEPEPAATPQSEDALQRELRWLRAEEATVTTASLREESVSHAPATIRVITKRQIRERGYRHLADLLKDLPGVDVLDHFYAEPKNQVVIRGVGGNSKFLILQDGIRINSPTGEPTIPIFENFPLYNAKQVEILYGPASALYGADAFTAVINIITEPPTPEGRTDATAELGEFNTRRADLYTAKRYSDQLALSLGGHYQETDAPDLARKYPDQFRLGDLVTFGGSTAVPKEQRHGYTGAYDSYSTWLKLEVGDGLTLGWNQSFMQNRLSEGDLPNATSYADGVENLSQLMTTYVRYRFELGEHLDGQVQANYSRYEQEPDTHFNNIFSDFQDAYKYSLGERYQVEPQVTFTMDPHTLTAGLTLEHFHAIAHTADLMSPYDTGKSPDDQNQFYPGSNGTLPVKFYDVSYNNYGAFLQEQSDWCEKWSTTLGLRADYNDDYGTTVNPRAGLVYRYSSNTTWKALYGQAFLAPSPFLRYSHFGSFAFQRPDGLYESFFFRVPNPDLNPEKLQTVELNVTHACENHLQLSAATYYTKVDDLILFAPTDPPDSNFVPGGHIETTTQEQNIGELDAYGYELTADQSFRWGTSTFDFWSSYSHVDGKLENTLSDLTADLPFTSRNMVKVGCTYNFNNRFIFTPTLRWNSSQAGFVPTADDPNLGKRTPDYTVVDLYAEVRNRRQSLSIFLRVSNLFDQRYYIGGLSGPTTFYQSPQDPRWMTAGLRVSF